MSGAVIGTSSTQQLVDVQEPAAAARAPLPDNLSDAIDCNNDSTSHVGMRLPCTLSMSGSCATYPEDCDQPSSSSLDFVWILLVAKQGVGNYVVLL